MFQVIYEACYATTDLALLLHQSNAGKHSPKMESTSAWNQEVVGTGFGKDQPRDEVPSPKLDCVLDSVGVDLSVPSKNDFSLSQSRLDITLARDSSLLARSLSVTGVTPAASTVLLPTTGDTLLAAGESWFVSRVNDNLPPVVPEKLSFNSKEDMVTADNLQEIKMKKVKDYQQPDTTDGSDSATTNCYKGNFTN